MRILALDSSGLVASVALVEGDGDLRTEQVIAEYTVNYKKTHSQTLLPMLDEIVRMTETDLETVDAIAVAAGPGSFTGLRIGSATAKGLGLALGKPLIHLPTLEGLACNLWGCEGIVCPIMDARRRQVYTGIYRFDEGRLTVLEDQMAVGIEELGEHLGNYEGKITFLGDGVPGLWQRSDRYHPERQGHCFCAGQSEPAAGSFRGNAGTALLSGGQNGICRGTPAGLSADVPGGKREKGADER